MAPSTRTPVSTPWCWAWATSQAARICAEVSRKCTPSGRNVTSPMLVAQSWSMLRADPREEVGHDHVRLARGDPTEDGVLAVVAVEPLHRLVRKRRVRGRRDDDVRAGRTEALVPGRGARSPARGRMRARTARSNARRSRVRRRSARRRGARRRRVGTPKPRSPSCRDTHASCPTNRSPCGKRMRVSSGSRRHPIEPRLRTSSAGCRLQALEPFVGAVQAPSSCRRRAPAGRAAGLGPACLCARRARGRARRGGSESATTTRGVGAAMVASMIAATIAAAVANATDTRGTVSHVPVAPADRPLDEAVRDDRHRERDRDADAEQRPSVEMRARFVEDDVDRPVPEIDAVADDAQRAQWAERQQPVDRPRRGCIAAAITTAVAIAHGEQPAAVQRVRRTRGARSM